MHRVIFVKLLYVTQSLNWYFVSKESETRCEVFLYIFLLLDVLVHKILYFHNMITM